MTASCLKSAIDNVKQLLETERDISPALKSALEVILFLVTLLLDRVTLNSKNSSKSSASDPNRKKNKCNKSDKPSGSQHSDIGKALEKVKDPDEIKDNNLDRRTLPKAHFTEDGFAPHQAFDIKIS